MAALPSRLHWGRPVTTRHWKHRRALMPTWLLSGFWVLEIRTLALMFVRQMFYPLSYFTSPKRDERSTISLVVSEAGSHVAKVGLLGTEKLT